MSTAGSRRSEFAANWRVLTGAVLGASVSSSGLFYYTSSVFFAELNQTLGWSKSELSLTHIVHTLFIAAMSPFIGAFMDRYGVRGPIVFSLCAQALCYTAIALAPANLTIFLILQASLSLLGSAATPLGYSRVVSARFDAGRGLALGLTISGLGIVAIVAPLLLTRIVAETGWRGGYLSVAAFVVLLGVPAMILLGPGRDLPSAGRHAVSAAGERPELARILRTPIFWLLLIAFVVPMVAGSGYMVHFIALLRERGFAPADAGMVASVIGVAVLAGRLCTGWIIDRAFAPRVLAIVFGLFAAGLCMLALGNTALVIPAALTIGFAMGAELDVLAYLVSRYFPLAAFGRVYGIIYGIVLGGGGTSALAISMMAEHGGYGFALIVSAVAIAASGILLMFAPAFPGEGKVAGKAG